MSRSCVGSPASGRKSPSFMVRRSCPGRRPAGKGVRRRRPPCMLDAAMQRVIDLEGCLNCRDLGGSPTGEGRTVRWQQVYRSDALHHLTPADVARVRDELRVAAVVDLRSTAELRGEGRGPLAGEPIGFHHLPLFDGREVRPENWPPIVPLADRYLLLAEIAQAPIARLLTEAGPMIAVLARIRERYGSMRGYARAAGVADAVVERLAERLLER